MGYEVKLEIFEGSLDLLLHLIHKNQLDIFDIPIAAITDQYLEYLELMKAFNITLAGDFLIMASTLIHIKSKMLLPEFKDDDNEDPLLEITGPLLEYVRFKKAAIELSDRSRLDRDVFIRKNTIQPDQEIKDEDYHDVNIFQLINAFKKYLKQSPPEIPLKFHAEKWSIKDASEKILLILKEHSEIIFHEIFHAKHSISEFIITFLALLELIHMGLIKVFQPTQESHIRLSQAFDVLEEKHG